MERLRYESGHKRIHWQTKVGSRWGKAEGLDLTTLPIYRSREVGESMQLGARSREGQGSGNAAPRQEGAARPAAAAGAAATQMPKEEDIPTINLDDEREDIKIEDVPF